MSGTGPESYQTVLNVLKLQKPQAEGNSDKKNDSNLEDSKLEAVEEYSIHDGDDIDTLVRAAMCHRLGQPRSRTSFVEEVDVMPFYDGFSDEKANVLSPHSRSSETNQDQRPQSLGRSVTWQERSTNSEMLSNMKGKSVRVTKKEKIELMFIPRLKSIRIRARRITLKLNEPLKLKDGNLKDEYDICEEIGSGSFGKVRRAVGKDSKKEVAIKRIKKKKLDDLSRAMLENEIRIMREIKHKSVVELLDVRDSEKYICLVLELCSGGDVFDWLDEKEQLDEVTAAGVLHQIVAGVKYLHGRGVVHRDLKLENLLIVKQAETREKKPVVVKIADFGFATTIKTPDALIEGTCGSLNYVAPEVLTSRPYTKACDLWSVGVILFTMLAGYLPFYEEESTGGRPRTFKRIQCGIYDFDDPAWKKVEDLAKSVVSGLLTVNVSERLTCNQVLNHKWMMSHVANA